MKKLLLLPWFWNGEKKIFTFSLVGWSKTVSRWFLALSNMSSCLLGVWSHKNSYEELWYLRLHRSPAPNDSKVNCASFFQLIRGMIKLLKERFMCTLIQCTGFPIIFFNLKYNWRHEDGKSEGVNVKALIVYFTKEQYQK